MGFPHLSFFSCLFGADGFSSREESEAKDRAVSARREVVPLPEAQRQQRCVFLLRDKSGTKSSRLEQKQSVAAKEAVKLAIKSAFQLANKAIRVTKSTTTILPI